MLPLIAGIVSSLLANQLPKVASAVVDKGVEYVEQKLNVKLTEDMSPELIQEIKAQANKHDEFLVEQSDKNTADARAMNASVQSTEHASTLSKNAAYIIDFCIVGAAIVVSWLAFFKGVPTENKELVYMALGSLWTLVGTIVNFHRGSSRQSQSKDDLIKRLSQ